MYLILVLAPAPACAHSPCPVEVPMQARERLDAALRERIREAPDSVVGVLLRTDRVPDEADRRAMAEAGLRVGTVAGTIVTGRLRACDAVRIAELPFVRHLELAREVPLPPGPPLDTPSAS